MVIGNNTFTMNTEKFVIKFQAFDRDGQVNVVDYNPSGNYVGCICYVSIESIECGTIFVLDTANFEDVRGQVHNRLIQAIERNHNVQLRNKDLYIEGFSIVAGEFRFRSSTFNVRRIVPVDNGQVQLRSTRDENFDDSREMSDVGKFIVTNYLRRLWIDTDVHFMRLFGQDVRFIDLEKYAHGGYFKSPDSGLRTLRGLYGGQTFKSSW